MTLDLSRYSMIDWDPEDDPDGNLAHCLRPDHLGPEPERLVDEILSGEPVELKMALKSAEYAIVGPESASRTLWVVLLDTSHKRGDWLRPVTGWRATSGQQAAWRQARRGGGTVTGWLDSP